MTVTGNKRGQQPAAMGPVERRNAIAAITNNDEAAVTPRLYNCGLMPN
jgi:hypothetical protein